MTYFYTILFSLGKPQENWYFYMMMMLYKSLVRTESIGAEDKFFVVADALTIAYGRKFHSLKNVRWVEAPPVLSVKEGMLYKYIFRPKTDALVVYLDCDFLAIKKVAFEITPDTFAVLPEGRPDDPNYCGDGRLDAKVGVSAGIFAFRYGPRTRALLDDIAKRHATCLKDFYTLDQPHFNYALVGKEWIGVINPAIVSFNGNGDNAVAHLLNCAGEPGNGTFHYQKMMDFFIML